MNTVDIILGVLLILAFYSGYKKGLFVALASLVGVILGIVGAYFFSDYTGDYIADWINTQPGVTKVVAFVITFIAIVVVIGMAGKVLTKIADFAALGLINKFLGGVFNTIKIAFVISVLFFFFGDSNVTGYVISEDKKEDSQLYDPIASLAPMVLPQLIDKIDEALDDDERPLQ